jgi:peptidoglycan hydrolase CwlO-like protein
MRFKNVQEYVDTLTPEERVKFKGIIDESLTREAEIKDNRAKSFDNLEKVKKNMSLLNTEFNNMVAQLNHLNDSLKLLSNKLDTLPKKTTTFSPPNKGSIEEV